MEAFLESVANYLYKQYPDSLSSIAVVFPNKRARLFFNQYLQENIDKPLIAPAYYTISEFIQELSGQTPADQLTLLFELYAVYADVTGSKESLDEFLYYCEMMLADFDDIDKYLVDPKQLFQNLHDIKDMEAYFQYLTEAQIKAIQKFWGTIMPGQESNEQKEFIALWQVLFTIYQKFNAVLNEKEISYEGKSYKNALVMLEQGKQTFQFDKIAFVGFNALNKCEHQLFKLLQKRDQGLFFWDFDDYYIKRSDFHEAAFFLKTLIKDFPLPPGFVFKSSLVDKTKKIEIINVPTDIGQAESLKVLLKDSAVLQDGKPEDLLLALADESLLMPVLHSLPENLDGVNISMGFPIKESLTFALVEAILNLHINKHQQGFFYKDVIKVSQNGILQKAIPDLDLDSFKNEIVIHNMVYISSAFFNQTNIEILNQVFNPRVDQTNFVEYLLQILKIIASGYSSSGTSYEVIEQEALYKIITKLKRIRSILEEQTLILNFRTLLHVIQKIISGLTVPFSGEPLSGIQVMGILETRTIDFKNILILSMNEGVFPKSGNVPSMIPYTLRHAFELPTVEHQDAIFAYYFYRLLQRANKVTLVYNSSAEGMKTGEPSRFIQQLKYEKSFNVLEKQFAYKVQPSLKKVITIEKDEKVMGLLGKYLNNPKSFLSPSALNSYITCKLLFYFRYLAKIKEPDQVSEDIEADVFGSILHKALEIIYKPYEAKDVNANEINEISKNENLINLAIDKAFYTEFFNPLKKDAEDGFQVQYSGRNLLLNEAIKRYIKKVLEYDQKNAPFHILKLEDEYYTELAISEQKKVRIGGVIDRLDKANGHVRVIDYKTGQVKNSFSTIEDLFDSEASGRNPAAFQTFLYALVVKEKFPNDVITPGLFFIRDMTSTKFDYRIKAGSGRAKEYVDSYLPFNTKFRELLQEKLQELFHPDISFQQTEDEKACSYCPYNVLCNK